MRNKILNGKSYLIRHVCMLLIFLIASSRLLAQDKQVTGKVVANDNDSALASASVTIKGTRTSLAFRVKPDRSRHETT